MPDQTLQDKSIELERATQRADKAEAELSRLQAAQTTNATALSPTGDSKAVTEPEQELRNDSMMAHLLDSLNAGKDIGHYGRLVFAITARHFMPHEEVMAWMLKDSDMTEPKAEVLLRQIESRGYNPPKREKILEYQKEQQFPILPHAEDPDCGNLYRNLKFPDSVYQHIEEYQEQKLAE